MNCSQPGLLALQAALAEAFTDGPVALYRTPSDANAQEYPLVAVFIHAADDAWHYCSAGLSELQSKRSNDDKSGWGLELTFRLLRLQSEIHPPTWPISLLQSVASSILRRREVFLPLHHVALGDPIVDGSKLDALVFAHDASLAPMRTLFGELTPTQLVGITSDEEALIAQGSAEGLLKELRRLSPALATDVARGSLLELPEVGHRLREAARREGACTSHVVSGRVAWRVQGEGFVVELGPATSVRENLSRLLRARVRFGRSLTYVGADQSIELRLAGCPECRIVGRVLLIELDEGSCASLYDQLVASARDGLTTLRAVPGVVISFVD